MYLKTQKSALQQQQLELPYIQERLAIPSSSGSRSAISAAIAGYVQTPGASDPL
jgi:hypothetical protein